MKHILHIMLSIGIWFTNSVRAAETNASVSATLLMDGAYNRAMTNSRNVTNSTTDTSEFISYRDAQVGVLKSDELVSRAYERLRKQYSPEQISNKLQRISVQPAGNSAIIELAVFSDDLEFGAAFANAWAEAFLELKMETALDRLRAQLVSLTTNAAKVREVITGIETKLPELERGAGPKDTSELFRQATLLNDLREMLEQFQTDAKNLAVVSDFDVSTRFRILERARASSGKRTH